MRLMLSAQSLQETGSFSNQADDRHSLLPSTRGLCDDIRISPQPRAICQQSLRGENDNLEQDDSLVRLDQRTEKIWKNISRIGAYEDWGALGVRRSAQRVICMNKNGQRDYYYRFYHMTEPWWAIRNAIDDIPNQTNGWSCGLVSSARFLAMTGWPVKDYIEYHNGAPTYASFHAEIGPGPRRLWRYMSKDGHLSGSNIDCDCTEDWETQDRRIRDSIRLHRPVLVLYEVNDRMLHWSVIVGQDSRPPFPFLLLDTDGYLFDMDPDTLRMRMDLNKHISRFMVAQLNPAISFEHISRYNSMSCTREDMAEDYHQKRTYGAHHNIHRLRGDRNDAHNVVNTVLDSPIVHATPLAPLAWLWRLL